MRGGEGGVLSHIPVIEVVEIREPIGGKKDKLIAFGVGEGNEDVAIFIRMIEVAIQPQLGVVEHVVLFIQNLEKVSIESSGVSERVCKGWSGCSVNTLEHPLFR